MRFRGAKVIIHGKVPDDKLTRRCYLAWLDLQKMKSYMPGYINGILRDHHVISIDNVDTLIIKGKEGEEKVKRKKKKTYVVQPQFKILPVLEMRLGDEVVGFAYGQDESFTPPFTFIEVYEPENVVDISEMLQADPPFEDNIRGVVSKDVWSPAESPDIVKSIKFHEIDPYALGYTDYETDLQATTTQSPDPGIEGNPCTITRSSINTAFPSINDEGIAEILTTNSYAVQYWSAWERWSTAAHIYEHTINASGSVYDVYSIGEFYSAGEYGVLLGRSLTYSYYFHSLSDGGGGSATQQTTARNYSYVVKIDGIEYPTEVTGWSSIYYDIQLYYRLDRKDNKKVFIFSGATLPSEDSSVYNVWLGRCIPDKEPDDRVVTWSYQTADPTEDVPIVWAKEPPDKYQGCTAKPYNIRLLTATLWTITEHVEEIENVY